MGRTRIFRWLKIVLCPQSPEAFFTHVPGIKVVMPSGPREAKGENGAARFGASTDCLGGRDVAVFLGPLCWGRG